MSRPREQLVEQERRRLLQSLSPRLHMTVMLLATGSVGFLASFGMLQSGVHAMWLRYPLAILFAYAVFLLLLRIWLYFQSGGLLIPDLPGDAWGKIGSESSKGLFSGGGGDAGGAGAGGTWSESGISPSRGSSGGGSFSSNFSFDLDLDEVVWIVLALAAVLGALLAVIYIIYIAPVLLAEVIVDGLLVSALYRRVKKLEQRHWLRTAVSNTVVPALIIAAFFSIAGFCLHMAAPEAHSIGGVWTSITSGEGK